MAGGPSSRPVSPRSSTEGAVGGGMNEAMMDLLTGFYSTTTSSVADPQLSGVTSSIPTFRTSFNAQEPMDLLTGLFTPVPAACSAGGETSSGGASPDVWNQDVFHSNDYYAGPAIASNNPFATNAGPLFQSMPSFRGLGWGQAENADGPAVESRLESSQLEGAFSTFNPFEKLSLHTDSETRPLSAASSSIVSSSLPPNRSPRSPPYSSGSSPTLTPKGRRTLTNLFESDPDCWNSGTAKSAQPASSSVSPDRRHFSLAKAEPSRPETPKSIPSVPIHSNDNTRRTSYEQKIDQRVPSPQTSARNEGKEHPGIESKPGSYPSRPGVVDEFRGNFGAKGVFNAPTRGAVHPSRPVSLELRPQPLRGAPPNQVFIIACTDSSVWAASEMGVMVWDVPSATTHGSSGVGNLKGDDDAAAYGVLRWQGSMTTCMAVDIANRIVWTGHRDGKVRAWPESAVSYMDTGTRETKPASLVFEAHRHSVTAMVITPHGELWTGSESGSLKAWPWEALAEALSLGGNDALLAKSRVEVKVRSVNTSANGSFNPEIRFLVAEPFLGRVWCGGAQYIAIWDARTRELVKVFGGASGQSDLSSVDFLAGHEVLLDEDLKTGYAKVSKKEKGGWLQRSRNAVMGAADSLRRVASGGSQGGDDSKRIDVLVASMDGSVLGGYGNGLLVQWDGHGHRIQEFQLRTIGIRSLCMVGNRLWVGYSDGRLHVLVGDGGGRIDTWRVLGNWQGHRSAVIQMALCGSLVFTLGVNGSIQGWSISSPSKLDEIVKTAMSSRADSYTRQQNLRVLVASWNTAQEKASLRSVQMWLASPSVEASVVVVGLQEVEMGAGAIGMAAVKETVGMGLQEKSSANGQWWLSHVDNVLGEGREFERVGARQLAGMLIGVWVRRKCLPYVGDVDVGAVACGFGRALGNKGAVGVKMTIFRRTICAISSHLAAHMEHVSRRNADFEHIYNQITFGRPPRVAATAVASAAAGVSTAVHKMLHGKRTTSSFSSEEDYAGDSSVQTMVSDSLGEEAAISELSEADFLVWTGDLNYRIDRSYDDTLDLISKKKWDVLLNSDQLRVEMTAGRTFNGMREGIIRFPPTYKFDKGYHVYDTSEKKRIPAWCDRVLFRDSFDGNDSTIPTKLTRPVRASVIWYEACMEPDESDHKPVRCMLNLDLSVIDEASRRRQFGDIMGTDPHVHACITMLKTVPESTLNTNRVLLEDNTPFVLRLSNEDRKQSMLFSVHCEGVQQGASCPCGKHDNLSSNDGAQKGQYPRAGYGLPRWLQVVPGCGTVQPLQSFAIEVISGMKPLEERGKELQERLLVLVINVTTGTSCEKKQHKVCVSQSNSPRKELRRLLYEHRRPSKEKELYVHVPKSQHASSSFNFQDPPDLLL